MTDIDKSRESDNRKRSGYDLRSKSREKRDQNYPRGRGDKRKFQYPIRGEAYYRNQDNEEAEKNKDRKCTPCTSLGPHKKAKKICPDYTTTKMCPFGIMCQKEHEYNLPLSS